MSLYKISIPMDKINNTNEINMHIDKNKYQILRDKLNHLFGCEENVDNIAETDQIINKMVLVKEKKFPKIKNQLVENVNKNTEINKKKTIIKRKSVEGDSNCKCKKSKVQEEHFAIKNSEELIEESASNLPANDLKTEIQVAIIHEYNRSCLAVPVAKAKVLSDARIVSIPNITPLMYVRNNHIVSENATAALSQRFEMMSPNTSQDIPMVSPQLPIGSGTLRSLNNIHDVQNNPPQLAPINLPNNTVQNNRLPSPRNQFQIVTNRQCASIIFPFLWKAYIYNKFSMEFIHKLEVHFNVIKIVTCPEIAFIRQFHKDVLLREGMAMMERLSKCIIILFDLTEVGYAVCEEFKNFKENYNMMNFYVNLYHLSMPHRNLYHTDLLSKFYMYLDYTISLLRERFDPKPPPPQQIFTQEQLQRLRDQINQYRLIRVQQAKAARKAEQTKKNKPKTAKKQKPVFILPKQTKENNNNNTATNLISSNQVTTTEPRPNLYYSIQQPPQQQSAIIAAAAHSIRDNTTASPSKNVATSSSTIIAAAAHSTSNSTVASPSKNFETIGSTIIAAPAHSTTASPSKNVETSSSTDKSNGTPENTTVDKDNSKENTEETSPILLETIDLTWTNDLDENYVQKEMETFCLKTEVKEENTEETEPNKWLQHICFCGNKASFLCACNIATYCSRDCQVKHWRFHQELCGKTILINPKENKS